jgi:hypothetical protein
MPRLGPSSTDDGTDAHDDDSFEDGTRESPARLQEPVTSAEKDVAAILATPAPALLERTAPKQDLLRPTWGIAEMQTWLRDTIGSNGESIESRLDSPLDTQLKRCAHVYAEGPRGFPLEISKLRFPNDPATLARLKEGIEAGAITGIAIEAYPDSGQLEAIAARLNPSDAGLQFETLLAETTIEFLARHFGARGGKIFHQETTQLPGWKLMRWQPLGGGAQWQAFHDLAASEGHDPADWLDANGRLTPIYVALQARVYDESLAVQPSVRDALGTTSVIFTDTRQDVPASDPKLVAYSVDSYVPGQGLSFVSLLQKKVDLLSPPEFLALMGMISNPADTSTYPDLETWEWHSGMRREKATLVYSSYHDGIRLRFDSPHWRYPHNRARPVIRGNS